MERLGEGLKKLALAGIGTAAYAVEKSADILDTLAKKGEETVEQGKVLNKELKHNVKSTIKDYKASNGKMHTVHEAEVVDLRKYWQTTRVRLNLTRPRCQSLMQIMMILH